MEQEYRDTRFDLTGTWKAYNNEGTAIATYYIRQVGVGSSSIQIYWTGGSYDPESFTEVFYGNRVGDEIIGQWVNVPRSVPQNIGSLRVEVRNNGHTLVRVDSTQRYDTAKWRKISSGFPKECSKEF